MKNVKEVFCKVNLAHYNLHFYFSVSEGVFRESGHQQITGGHPVRNNAVDFFLPFLLHVLDPVKAIDFRNTILLNQKGFSIIFLPD